MRTFGGLILLLGCIGATGCGGSAARSHHVSSNGRQTIVVVGARGNSSVGQSPVNAHIHASSIGAPAGADKPTSSPQAVAYAHVVNLRISDLPGFKLALAGESEHGDAPSGPLPRPVEECDGGPVVNGASRGVASPLFQKESVPIQTILSIVYPMRDRSIASAYIAAADGGRGLGCLQREEVRKRAASGLHGNTEVVALAPPLAGAPVSGVRIWRCLPGSQPCRNRDDRSFTDRLWFAAGPYVVTIFYIAPAQNEAKGPEPLALPLERHLVALLYNRAEAHKL